MENLIIKYTPETPSIHFDANSGLLQIKGRCIPSNPDDFWSEILLWFDTYIQQPAIETKFIINLEYFNISSSKRILFLLYKLNELIELGYKASVDWYYRESEEDMFEVGQDYAYMVKVPFNFYSTDELDVVTI
jgi:hypothetical protein